MRPSPGVTPSRGRLGSVVVRARQEVAAAADQLALPLVHAGPAVRAGEHQLGRIVRRVVRSARLGPSSIEPDRRDGDAADAAAGRSGASRRPSYAAQDGAGAPGDRLRRARAPARPPPRASRPRPPRGPPEGRDRSCPGRSIGIPVLGRRATRGAGPSRRPGVARRRPGGSRRPRDPPSAASSTPPRSTSVTPERSRLAQNSRSVGTRSIAAPAGRTLRTRPKARVNLDQLTQNGSPSRSKISSARVAAVLGLAGLAAVAVVLAEAPQRPAHPVLVAQAGPDLQGLVEQRRVVRRASARTTRRRRACGPAGEEQVVERVGDLAVVAQRPGHLDGRAVVGAGRGSTSPAQ